MMSCSHTTQFDTASWTEPIPASEKECVGCHAEGADVWSHLRLCLTCGYVGCCDSSPLKHAFHHYQDTGHAVVRSFEPGESWRWCYEDRRLV